MEPTYSVSELSSIVARALGRALPNEVWIEGEIRDLARSRNGHVYFTLVDPDGDAGAGAALPVALFAPDRDAVNRVLIKSGAVRMTDGVHVRIRGQVTFYAPRSSVQLRMTWIDTDYTVGKLAAARRALLRKLELNGDLDRNRALPVPGLPLRVGLVTSVGSAAHADFIAEIERSGFGFSIVVADARVQGVEGATSIVDALAALASAGVDVAAVVRGGGAQTDLAVFDTEAVAHAIAHAPFPVFTGIGHEIDRSVADQVAAASFKTPTACAQHLVELIQTAVRTLDASQLRLVAATGAALQRSERETAASWRRISAGVQRRLVRHERALSAMTATISVRAGTAPHVAAQRLDGLAQRIAGTCRSAANAHNQRIAEAHRRLVRSAEGAVGRAVRRLASVESLRRAHAPERMLARGWSVTYGAGGRPVRTADDVAVGDRIRTRLASGAIESTVDIVEQAKTS